MKFRMTTRFGVLGLCVSVISSLAVPAGALAQNDTPPATPPADKKADAPAEDLAKAEEILDRFVKETGGKEAWNGIKTLVKIGKLNMAMQIEGDFKEYVKMPGKMYSELTLGQFGDVKTGSDGETVWQESTMQGPRILEGAEREMSIETAIPGKEANWRDWFKEVTTVGVADVKGKPAYKVELTPKEGTKRTAYYDKETGLMVREDRVLESQMGKIPLQSYISDYKKVGDLVFPHKVSVSLPSGEMVTTYEKIEVNVDIPDSKFELPADIKELKEAKAKKAEKKDAEPAGDPEKK